MDDVIVNASITLKEADGANTKLEYMYRDGFNYKTSGEAVFAGRIAAQQVRDIAKALDDRAYFIPGQVGLQDLQDSFINASEWNPEADHPWHEVMAISYTGDAPTQEDSASEFVARVKNVTWDDGYKPPFYDTMVQRYEQRIGKEELVVEAERPASVRLRLRLS